LSAVQGGRSISASFNQQEPTNGRINSHRCNQPTASPDLARKLIRTPHPRNLPVVLIWDEVTRLLNATTCLKHQAALSVSSMDAAGLYHPHRACRSEGGGR